MYTKPYKSCTEEIARARVAASHALSVQHRKGASTSPHLVVMFVIVSALLSLITVSELSALYSCCEHSWSVFRVAMDVITALPESQKARSTGRRTETTTRW